MSIHGGVPKHLDDKNMLKIQDDLKCRSHLDMGQDNVDVYMDLYGSIWLINCVFFMTKWAMVQVVSSEIPEFFVQL
jgi:hypothetical protein